MAHSWIDQAKFTPPVMRIHLARPRLVEALRHSATRHKLAIINADAGFGKTALLRELRETLKGRVVWYTFDNEDADAVFFLQRLLRGLLQLRPETGSAPSPRLDGQVPELWGRDDLMAAIRAILKANSRDLFVLCDNYERVSDSSDVNGVLRLLLEQSPPWVHFVVATRSIPRFGIARLRALREVFELSERDLAFSIDEIKELLLSFEGIALKPGELQTLEARTGGWVAGIVMICQSLRHRSSHEVFEFLADETHSARVVFDYFAEEVFSGQSSAVQDFLMRSSIIQYFDVDLCASLLELPSAGELLDFVRAEGLFLTTVEPTGQFHYHQLFRHFLTEKLRRTRPEAEVRALHARAARLAVDRREWDGAIDHYCACQQPSEAVAIVERIGRDYVEAGLTSTVLGWIKQLPSALLEQRPWMMALLGSCLMRHGDDYGGRHALQRAAVLSESSGQPTTSAWANWQLAEFALRRAHFGEAIMQLEQALAQAGTDRFLRVGILSTLGLAYGINDNLDQAMGCEESALREAGGLPNGLFAAGVRSRIRRYLALTYIREGRGDAALSSARRAVEISDQEGLGVRERSWGLCVLGIAQAIGGSYEDALQSFSECEELTREDLRLRQRWVGLWRGSIWRDRGDFERAETDYELAGPAALADRAFLQIRCGETALALRLLRGSDRTEQLPLSEAAKRRATHGLALIADGSLEPGLAEVAAAAKTFREKGYAQLATSLEVHLCHHELQAGLVADRELRLRRLFGVLLEGGYRHLYWWVPDVIVSLCVEALRYQISNSIATELVGRCLDAENARGFFGLLNSEQPMTRQMALGVLVALGEGASSVRTFATDLAGADMDAMTRQRIVQSLDRRQVGVDMLLALRQRYGLSWREIEVLLVYYLGLSRAGAVESQPMSPSVRFSCAEELCMSENTLKTHIKNLRRKLGLSDRANVVTALLQGNTPTPPVAGLAL
ncbi:MAG: hypothetical protein HY329_19785 [Chloroflexi bacterium]|nr:hypothetical protein [Chloroflexota bacterium]